jgi:hypothetical protein
MTSSTDARLGEDAPSITRHAAATWQECDPPFDDPMRVPETSEGRPPLTITFETRSSRLRSPAWLIGVVTIAAVVAAALTFLLGSRRAGVRKHFAHSIPTVLVGAPPRRVYRPAAPRSARVSSRPTRPRASARIHARRASRRRRHRRAALAQRRATRDASSEPESIERHEAPRRVAPKTRVDQFSYLGR